MFQALPVFWSDCDGPLYRLTVEVERCFFSPVFVELDVDCLAVIGIFQDDVDVHGGGEEEGRHGGG
jgi:hypothetical protein